MPKLCATHTAVPDYKVDQATAKSFAQIHFSPHVRDIERLLAVFDHAGVETRYFSRPLEWFGECHTLSEKNATYIECATDLVVEATEGVLAKLSLKPKEIDYILYVNTTGLATPSIDARLINRLNFRDNVRRTPIWGLGCAGGAAGLAHAYHHALGHPKDKILLVAAELCGLTFLPQDFSKSNLVASSLFGEGAAAAVIAGDKTSLAGLDIIGTQSRFYPDSLDVMGWNVLDNGLQVIFARRIPDIVANHAMEDLSKFLVANRLIWEGVGAYLFHPGGTKVLEAYERALGISNGHLEYSRNVLRDYGNMSSVTVLFVLDEYLKNVDDRPEGAALLSALGPGFCSESVLIANR